MGENQPPAGDAPLYESGYMAGEKERGLYSRPLSCSIEDIPVYTEGNLRKSDCSIREICLPSNPVGGTISEARYLPETQTQLPLRLFGYVTVTGIGLFVFDHLVDTVFGKAFDWLLGVVVSGLS